MLTPVLGKFLPSMPMDFAQKVKIRYGSRVRALPMEPRQKLLFTLERNLLLHAYWRM
jgi:hypothetical protein